MKKYCLSAPSLPGLAAFILPAILLAFLAMPGCLGSSQTPAEAGQFTYSNATVAIMSASGNYTVNAQVAATQEQQEFGLMFRESLAGGQGMVFPFPAPGNYAFYMKNMKIPLDIIYAKDAGGSDKGGLTSGTHYYQIQKITADIQPCKADPCPLDYSGDGASLVLEVPSGYAAAHRLATGDRLIVNYG